MNRFPNLTSSTRELFLTRSASSQAKLELLNSCLQKSAKTGAIPELCIFAAGSYARLEASEHSDIDLFFLTNTDPEALKDINIPNIQLFSEIIDIGNQLNFPKFSNDGEFLKLLYIKEIEQNLGSRDDDFHNHFTARMLLILESRPIFGSDVYDKLLRKTIDAYFRDYSHHPRDFRPTFLVNDIMRFWKTLCLNYEHGRNQIEDRDKIKQKIKNFKLKYSRLLTCFATMACLSTYRDTISPDNVFDICKKTPIQRIMSLHDYDNKLKYNITKVLESYAWFIMKTGLSKDDLESYFSEKENRIEAFLNAQNFGDILFELLLEINAENNVLRYMVL